MYIVHNCGRRLKTLLDREHGTVWQVLQYITVHYITVQYSTVVAGGGGGELQLQPRGRAAGAGRHRTQVPERSTVQYSTVQLTVQCSVLQVHHSLEDRVGASRRFETCLKIMELYFVHHWIGY